MRRSVCCESGERRSEFLSTLGTFSYILKGVHRTDNGVHLEKRERRGKGLYKGRYGAFIERCASDKLGRVREDEGSVLSMDDDA